MCFFRGFNRYVRQGYLGLYISIYTREFIEIRPTVLKPIGVKLPACPVAEDPRTKHFWVGLVKRTSDGMLRNGSVLASNGLALKSKPNVLGRILILVRTALYVTTRS